MASNPRGGGIDFLLHVTPPQFSMRNQLLIFFALIHLHPIYLYLNRIYLFFFVFNYYIYYYLSVFQLSLNNKHVIPWYFFYYFCFARLFMLICVNKGLLILYKKRFLNMFVEYT